MKSVRRGKEERASLFDVIIFVEDIKSYYSKQNIDYAV